MIDSWNKQLLHSPSSPSPPSETARPDWCSTLNQDKSPWWTSVLARQSLASKPSSPTSAMVSTSFCWNIHKKKINFFRFESRTWQVVGRVFARIVVNSVDSSWQPRGGSVVYYQVLPQLYQQVHLGPATGIQSSGSDFWNQTLRNSLSRNISLQIWGLTSLKDLGAST